MRSKHVSFEIEFDQGSVPQSKKINKNREQLRKKLKDLLEREIKNFYLFGSNESVNSGTSKTKGLQKTTYKKMLKNVKGSKTDKPMKDPKKKTTFQIGMKKKSKTSNILKRKSTESAFLEEPAKATKTARISKIIPSVNTVKQKPKPVVATTATVLKTRKCPSKAKVALQTKTEMRKPTVNTTRIPIKNLSSVQPKKQVKLTKQPTQATIERSKIPTFQTKPTPTPQPSPTKKLDPEGLLRSFRKPIILLGSESDIEDNFGEEIEKSHEKIDMVRNFPETVDEVFDDTDDYHSYSCEDSSSDDMIHCETNSSELNNTESDPTYELPDHIPEDVYIANGAAVIHDLSENNEVRFDSDTDGAQIIEILSKPCSNQPYNNGRMNAPNTLKASQKPVQSKAKGVPKPKPSLSQKQKTATDTNSIGAPKSKASLNKKSSLRQTQPNFNINLAGTSQSEKHSFDEDTDESCPQLIPIEYMQDETDSECYSDCLSSDSDSEEKKLYGQNKQTVKFAQPKMVPAIFKKDKNATDDTDVDFFDVITHPSSKMIIGSPLERVANKTTSKTMSCKVITTNNEVFKPESQPGLSARLLAQKEAHPALEVVPIETLPPVAINNDSPRVKDSSFEIPLDIGEQEIFTPKSTIDSTFQTTFFNAINSNQVIVLLKNPLYIYGTVKLKLLAGSLEIFGYNPKQNETLEIFSPRGYSSLKIEPSKKPSAIAPLNEKDLFALMTYFIRADLEEILYKFDQKTDAIVVLERNDRSKKVNMLKKYMVENLFPNMNCVQSDRPFFTSEFLLRCVITPKTDKALIVDPKWRAIPVNSDSTLMVIGGKSVGKTTLLRYLINTNLNKFPSILLIDLDIGQPEIFVPQTISATTLSEPLLGPGYFSVKEPDKAFLVGQTNVILLPQRYIENVKALIEYCKANKEYRGIPWLINTMGYNKGFGDELIAIICSFLNPTNIIQLESNREINNFDVIMNRENMEFMDCNIIGDMFDSDILFRPQHNLTLMCSAIPNERKKYQTEWEMNPRDMRLAMIISRLSAILTGHAEWIADVKPVCASTDDIRIINFGDDYATEEDLLKALGGNLVYLCQDYSGKNIECLGIGIVRGVDFPLKQIYLLPAVSTGILERVNCLAICGIPLPSSILINQGPKVKGLASYVYNTIDKVASMYVNQIYHRPQHFLTGRYKSIVE